MGRIRAAFKQTRFFTSDDVQTKWHKCNARPRAVSLAFPTILCRSFRYRLDTNSRLVIPRSHEYRKNRASRSYDRGGGITTVVRPLRLLPPCTDATLWACGTCRIPSFRETADSYPNEGWIIAGLPVAPTGPRRHVTLY